MPAPLVSLKEVNVRYRKTQVLRNVSGDFHAGEVVGVIGRGGAGKTQLLRVLTTLLSPNSGTVVLMGKTVVWWQRRTLVEVRKSVGLQFQNFALFDFLDVHHNVTFPLEHQGILGAEEISSRAREALERVGLASAETLFPGELSGGMRRRVAIARVMAARPPIAVFDDPVAGLDPINSAKIMRLLGEFARDGERVVFVATHDLERLFPVATRLLFLESGEVDHDGPTAKRHLATSPRFLDFVEAATETAADFSSTV